MNTPQEIAHLQTQIERLKAAGIDMNEAGEIAWSYWIKDESLAHTPPIRVRVIR